MHYFLPSALALAWLVILLGGWLGWQLLRQNGRVLLRLEELEQRLNELEYGEGESPSGLSLGTEAPAFELTDIAGGTGSLAQYRGQRLLLVFFNPACGFCRELLPKLKEKLESLARMTNAQERQVPQVLLISTGTEEANRAMFLTQDLPCPVLLQRDMEVGAAYQANGTPSACLVSAEGRIGSALAMGGDAVLALLDAAPDAHNPKPGDKGAIRESAGANGQEREQRFSNRSLARSKIKRDGLKAGAPAPDFRLPRLDGRGELALSELRGRRVMLVFSSPGCGPCLAVAPRLQEFHRAHPELEMVMISKGEPKDNRAKVKQHGLTFPVLLQQHWEISRRYAMFATPVAYLIDEAGVIAENVAVGSDAIQRLLERVV
jgi:peroxiredoxin